MSKKSRSGKRSNSGWFHKGRSGNPGGRPTGSRARSLHASAIDVLTDKTLEVPHRGGTREITTEEALQQRTYQAAIDGDRTAIREVMKWIQKREDWFKKRARQISWRPIKSYVSPDPDNADAALLLLGITRPDLSKNVINGRAPMLLELWAVQAALRRRRGGYRLTGEDRSTIRRCTRGPDQIRWSRGSQK